MRTWHLPIRGVDKRVFLALKNGKKTTETRALNDPKSSRYYGAIRAGDILLFACGRSRLKRRVRRVRTYRTIAALIRREPFRNIMPWAKTREDLARSYDAYPDYPRRIRRYGLIALYLR